MALFRDMNRSTSCAHVYTYSLCMHIKRHHTWEQAWWPFLGTWIRSTCSILEIHGQTKAHALCMNALYALFKHMNSKHTQHIGDSWWKKCMHIMYAREFSLDDPMWGRVLDAHIHMGILQIHGELCTLVQSWWTTLVQSWWTHLGTWIRSTRGVLKIYDEAKAALIGTMRE